MKLAPKLLSGINLKHGVVELHTSPDILHDIIDMFSPSVLRNMGIMEDMEIILYALIEESDAWDRSIWLLKRGPDFLFIELDPVRHRYDIQAYVVSRVVQPKSLKAIVGAIKARDIKEASEVRELKKEGIVFTVHESEDDILGTVHTIRVQSNDNEDADVDD